MWQAKGVAYNVMGPCCARSVCPAVDSDARAFLRAPAKAAVHAELHKQNDHEQHGRCPERIRGQKSEFTYGVAVPAL